MLLSSILKKFTDMSLCKSNSALMQFNKILTQLPKLPTVNLNNKISISSNKFRIINSYSDVVLNAKKSIIYFRVPVSVKEKNVEKVNEGQSKTSDMKLTEENRDKVECEDRFTRYEALHKAQPVQAVNGIKAQQNNKLIVIKNPKKGRNLEKVDGPLQKTRQIGEVLVLEKKIQELIKKNKVTEAVIPTSRLNKRFVGRKIVQSETIVIQIGDRNEGKPSRVKVVRANLFENSMKQYNQTLSELLLKTKIHFRLVEKSVEEPFLRTVSSLTNRSHVEINKEVMDWKVAEKYNKLTTDLYLHSVKRKLKKSLKLHLIKTASLENEIQNKTSLIDKKLKTDKESLDKSSKFGGFFKLKEYFVPDMKKIHLKGKGNSNIKGSESNIKKTNGVKGIKFLSLVDLCKRRTTDPSLFYKDVCGKMRGKKEEPKLMKKETLESEIKEKNAKIATNFSEKQRCDSQKKEKLETDGTRFIFLFST